MASDRWLTALSEHEDRARRIIALLEEIIQKNVGATRSDP
jgi:hypothetical protein